MAREQVEYDLFEDLEITSDLETEFIEQAAKFARWSFLLVRASEEVRRLEDRLEVLNYSLYAKAKLDLGDGSKENECRAVIRSDDDYRETKADLAKAKAVRDTLKVTIDALMMRKEMLQQLGPLYRKEYEMSLAGVPKETSAREVSGALRHANNKLKQTKSSSPRVEDVLREAQKANPQDLQSLVDRANAIGKNRKGKK